MKPLQRIIDIYWFKGS